MKGGMASFNSKYSREINTLWESGINLKKAFRMKLAAMVFFMGLVCSAFTKSTVRQTSRWPAHQDIEADSEAAPSEGNLQ